LAYAQKNLAFAQQIKALPESGWAASQPPGSYAYECIYLLEFRYWLSRLDFRIVRLLLMYMRNVYRSVDFRWEHQV